MRPYQKVLGISIIVLLTGIIISLLLKTLTNQSILFDVAAIMVAPSGILTIIFMLSYKNRLLINILFWAMPVLLLLYFIAYIYVPIEIPIAILFLFLCYVILVNLVVHFFRYDMNLIVLTFVIILGLLFKRFHMAGAGMIMTLSILLSAVFMLIIAIRALRIKDNRYLSIVIFSCGLILAATSVSFVFKIQHWVGAGSFIMIMVPIFIIATLIILLTLPGSNFIEWTRQQKRILLRGILVPWLFFIYIIATTLLIPPYNQFKPFFFLKEDTTKVNFYMEDYEVENRNGLE